MSEHRNWRDLNSGGDHLARRRRFVAEQRRESQRHFRQTAATYDQRYGELKETHLGCLRQFLAAIKPEQELLDAACGTGKYFGVLTASGQSVFGIDQSPEMLEQAREKWPSVPTQRMALQDLRNAQCWQARFAGLVCIFYGMGINVGSPLMGAQAQATTIWRRHTQLV